MNENTKCLVRRASAVDLESLVPLFDGYRQFYRQPSDLDLARRFLLERLVAHESVIFLAVDDRDFPVGFTQLFPSFSSLSAHRIYILNDLFVLPAVRRLGIASLLLHAAALFAREAGAVRLKLSTEVTNVTAQALYAREGWLRQSDFYTYTLEIT